MVSAVITSERRVLLPILEKWALLFSLRVATEETRYLRMIIHFEILWKHYKSKAEMNACHGQLRGESFPQMKTRVNYLKYTNG